MEQRCLLIADDLTGGADAGAQFAKNGFRTLLVSVRSAERINFSKFVDIDVLVINTGTRDVSPEKAFCTLTDLLGRYDKKLFPLIYKKIDSTLRGNIGYEIDAILKQTNHSMCFITPSYPEQNRTLVGGIMMVRGKPLSLTEVAHDRISPVQESHIDKLLKKQSSNKIGIIDLTHVASQARKIQTKIDEERSKGTRFIIFDAVSRQDLTNIAIAAFSMEETPLFVGSAGLAEEVAKRLRASTERKSSQALQRTTRPVKHVFIISGSTSSVTNRQISLVSERNVPVFQINKSLLREDDIKAKMEREKMSDDLAYSLSRGNAILRTFTDTILSQKPKESSINIGITETLANITLSALGKSKMNIHDFALVLTGGDTALSLINAIGAEAIEIEGELLEGIVIGYLRGGRWDGLTVVTKAGAFGGDDSLLRIFKLLERYVLNNNKQ